MEPAESGVIDCGTEACVHMLHLDDSAADAELVQNRLKREGFPCHVTLASNRESFEAALARQAFDLILTDHTIPGYDGFSALRHAQAIQPLTPVIMLSGTSDDAQALESLKRGATYHLLKHRLPRLVPAIRRALREAERRKKQMAGYDQIRAQTGRLTGTERAFPDCAGEDRIVFWNKGAECSFGWQEDQALDRSFSELLQADAELLADARERVVEAGEWQGEMRFKANSGGEIVTISRWSCLRDHSAPSPERLAGNTSRTGKAESRASSARAQPATRPGTPARGFAPDLNMALAPVLICIALGNTSHEALGQSPFTEDRRLVAVGMVIQH